MTLLVRWGVLTLAVWLADLILGGVNINDGLWNHLWVAALFGLANAFIGNIIRLLALPAILITFGLFTIVVNAWMLMLVAQWTDALQVDGFWSAFFAGVVISVVSALMSRVDLGRD